MIPLAIAIAVLVVVAAIVWAGRTLLAGLRAQLTAEHEQTIARLSAERDAQVNSALTAALALAGETFGDKLQTGTHDFALRSESFDKRVDEMASVFTKQMAAVDHLVTEKVGGVSEVVSERVGGMSRQVGQQMGQMGKELSELRGLVADLQKERANQHGQLIEGLAATVEQQKALAQTTDQLRQALASPKARGQWGERMAEDVLRLAGFREGVNFRKQARLEGGTTPDFSFFLPNEQLLHMDVKFPIDNYLRYLEADNDRDAHERRSQFLRDVRDRVKELTGRGYSDSATTLGYILLFIPNEAVYGFVHENDTDLLDVALRNRVVLCSPSTLFAVLGVVRQAMDNFMVERTSDEILRCLADFGDQWDKFAGHIDKVERNLSTLNNSFGELSGPRRRQLERQLDRLEEVRSRVDRDDELGAAARPQLREVSGG